ncbi:type II secretion system protein [Vibrio diabolicus]|uniref:type II secretion system protein n=1 Tax=Vibrio diabolicus TaxID=50719 RepID=UPI003D7DB799
MKRQGGFTLIELVVVIVILGILAVTAAPRFLNLQSDARASALAGLSGAITGAAGIVYGKSAIEGQENVAKTVSPAPEVENVLTQFGYPVASDLADAVTGLAEDWQAITLGTQTVTPAAQAYGFEGAVVADMVFDETDDSANTGCYVIYVEAADADTPAYARAVTDGC